MDIKVTQKQGKLEVVDALLKDLNTVGSRSMNIHAAFEPTAGNESVRSVASTHNHAFVMLEGKAGRGSTGSGLQNMYPTVEESCIRRPPGQCITISHQGDESVGIFGDRAELWLDIAYLDDVDLLNLKERLAEVFTELWDFPAQVMLPGEEV
jgi:hypothetical protein